MPEKACERYIFHVMASAYFFEMPKIRTLSVSLSEFSTRAFFCVAWGKWRFERQLSFFWIKQKALFRRLDEECDVF